MIKTGSGATDSGDSSLSLTLDDGLSIPQEGKTQCNAKTFLDWIPVYQLPTQPFSLPSLQIPLGVPSVSQQETEGGYCHSP